MRWKEAYEEKVVDAAQAAAAVKDGDLVRLPLGPMPITVMNALAQRRHELKSVTVIQSIPPLAYEWLDEPDCGLHLKTEFVSAFMRGHVNRGVVPFMVSDYSLGSKVSENGRDDNWHSDVFIGVLSPPDQHGFMSFGRSLWYNKRLAQAARIRIAEVTPRAIRTGGDNFIHVSEFQYLVERTDRVRDDRSVKDVTPARREIIESIGGHVAELVNDSDTIQLGSGTVSSCMGYYLVGKKDLTLDSEVIPHSGVELVKLGVATGAGHKTHPGKAVTSGIAPGADYAFVDGNPLFELYDIEYINHVPRIAQNERQVAINQALTIDLSGQVTGESFGPRMFSGPGGQLAWTAGAMYSRGGRSIHVLPSITEDGGRSRIVPLLQEGTVVTVPRTFVDFVVTEHGVTNLQGKTERERARALIGIAHPQFREELTAKAKELFG